MQTDKQQTRLHQIFEDHNSNSKNNLPPEDVVDLVDNILALSKSTSYVGQVSEFHDKFKQVINHTPVFPNKETILLRLSLMLEELSELGEACGSEIYTEFQRMLFKKADEVRKEIEDKRETLQPSLTRVLDALIDHEYVSAGTVNAFGMQKVFPEAFEEVHSSNMSKACANRQEAENTQKDYSDKGTVSYIEEQADNTFLVYRTEDKKVLKSINYKPANLSQFLTN